MWSRKESKREVVESDAWGCDTTRRVQSHSAFVTGECDWLRPWLHAQALRG